MRVIAALAIAGSAFAPSAQAASRYIDVELVSESVQPKPGRAVLVGLRMTPKPGWHSYWSNPGEAGFPTTIKWSTPDGVRFGPLRHPAPTLLQVAGMTSYVHAGPHVLLSQMTLDRDIQPGTPLPVTAEVGWAACSDKLCVPQKTTLTLELTAGNGERSDKASLLRRALAREPKGAGLSAFDVEDGNATIQVPVGLRLNPAKARFFPDENGTFDAARQRAIDGSPLRITAPMGGAVPRSLSGVVSDGSTAYRVTFERKALEPAEATTERAEAPITSTVEPRADLAPAIPERAPAKGMPVTAETEDDRSWWVWAAIGLGVFAALALLAMALFRRSTR